ncbi:unnamed protein product [Merluccius merluccius]
MRKPATTAGGPDETGSEPVERKVSPAELWRRRAQTPCDRIRGFAGWPVMMSCNMLGIKRASKGASKQRATKMVTEAADVTAKWLRIRRGEPWSLNICSWATASQPPPLLRTLLRPANSVERKQALKRSVKPQAV